MRNSAIRVVNALLHSEIIEARRSQSQSVDEAAGSAGCRAECVSTRLTAGCLTWWTV